MAQNPIHYMLALAKTHLFSIPKRALLLVLLPLCSIQVIQLCLHMVHPPHQEKTNLFDLESIVSLLAVYLRYHP